MKKQMKAILIAAALTVPVLFADAAVRQGSMEAGFSGTYARLNAGDGKLNLRMLDADFGYFVTPAIEVSGILGYFDTRFEGEKLRAWMLGAGADYHFMPRTDLVPYVGGALRWVDAKAGGLKDDDWAWEVRGGLKQFLNRNTAIKYQISYIDFNDLKIDGVLATVGLSFFF